MGIRSRIKDELERRTEEAINNTSLNATMAVFEHIQENGCVSTCVKLEPAPNDINPKMYYENVRERTARLVDGAPKAYAGHLALNRELTDDRSLSPVGLGAEGWLWDVVPDGGTLVFTPKEYSYRIQT